MGRGASSGLAGGGADGLGWAGWVRKRVDVDVILLVMLVLGLVCWREESDVVVVARDEGLSAVYHGNFVELVALSCG